MISGDVAARMVTAPICPPTTGHVLVAAGRRGGRLPSAAREHEAHGPLLDLAAVVAAPLVVQVALGYPEASAVRRVAGVDGGRPVIPPEHPARLAFEGRDR